VDDRIERVLATIGGLSPFEVRIIETAALILLLILIRVLLVFIIGRQTTDARLRYHWSKGVSYALVAIGVLVIGRVWIAGIGPVATFLGLVGAGLVIALKEPLSNFAAWLFMLWRRPFVVGDRIEIGLHAGDVIDQRVLQFTILEINRSAGDQSTGRVIHVPNGRLFIDPVVNYTRGFPYLWNEIEVQITFESNWRAAKELLRGVAERHGRTLSEEAESEVLAQSQRFMIFYSTLAPTVYTRASAFGIVFSIRYLCEVRRRRDTEQQIWEAVLTSFAERADIDFAYPTRRLFNRETEERTLRGHGPESAAGLEL
jgi:small-conductance mechanosensitive channel